MVNINYLAVDEGRIAYEDSGGDGDTIICIPGMGDVKSVYRFITEDLKKKGFRVISFDLRGMGNSSVSWKDYSESSIASDIVSLINHLGLKSVVLMGNSISAGSAVIVSAEHPELISKTVLISPFVRNVPISRLKVLMFRLALLRPWGASVWVKYLTSNLYPTVKPPDLEQYRDSLKAMLKEKGRMKAFQKMANTTHDKAEESIKAMKVPTLLVMGSRDLDFPDPEKEANLLAQLLGARKVMIEGAGHYPQAEFPEKFVGYLLEFLGEQNAS